MTPLVLLCGVLVGRTVRMIVALRYDMRGKLKVFKSLIASNLLQKSVGSAIAPTVILKEV